MARRSDAYVGKFILVFESSDFRISKIFFVELQQWEKSSSFQICWKSFTKFDTETLTVLTVNLNWP